MGRLRKETTLEVNIPEGIADGQTLSVRGQGDKGINGGPAGDLNISVAVRSHPIFERDGFDIHCVIPITFVQATLGDEIVVPTIDGKVKYTVPEGTQSGTVFRLKGKGIKYLNGRGKGDQYVTVNVEIPRHLTKSQKDAVKKLEDTISDSKHYEKKRSFTEKIKDLF